MNATTNAQSVERDTITELSTSMEWMNISSRARAQPARRGTPNASNASRREKHGEKDCELYMRCKYHVSIDMRIILRKPPRKHRGPGDTEGEQKSAMAVCPVMRCPWVAEVADLRTVRLSKANRTAVHVA